MEREARRCFDCLQRRISSDFSNKLLFSYGISDSAFPFGTTAVVQLPSSTGEVPAEFMLVYLRSREHDCLIKYIDDCHVETPEENGDNENGKGTCSSEVKEGQREESCNEIPVASQLGKCQCSSNGTGTMLRCGSGCQGPYCGRFSCSRTISALAPVARVGTCSYSTFEEIASSLISGSMEDHVLSSLSLLVEGKAAGRDSVNFLSLIGVPSFSMNNVPGCLRHPNIVPIVGLLKSDDLLTLVLPKYPFTLENVLFYCPSMLKSDWQVNFLVYQLLSALSCLHGLGIAHGNVCPSNIGITDSCWLGLQISSKPQLNEEHSVLPPSKVGCCTDGCLSQGLYADLKLSSSTEWDSAFYQWWRGELSNFEYLLLLNRLAGRRWGDHTFYTAMPWVIDFSTKPDENSEAGWRDLSKTKWRLAKGDEQLDFTYSTSEVPHHVSDECLSELAVCSYKARRLPLSVLRMAVRSVYEPNEYPLTIQRLYQWTPDECIPEFYCDPQIFHSLHSGMTDLAIPTWANTPEEFIKLHRNALESNRVSLQIHHWIDITFGYKMSGEAAVAAKNVMLPSSEPTMLRSVGRRQLFTQPHPIRLSSTTRVRDCLKEANTIQCSVSKVERAAPTETAYLQELEQVSAFCEHALHLNPLYFGRLGNTGKEKYSFQEAETDYLKQSTSTTYDGEIQYLMTSSTCSSNFMDYVEVGDEVPKGYQDLLLWNQKIAHSKPLSEDLATDIFSVGCILAELYLRKPLFNSTSLASYLEFGVLPGLMQELPFHTKVVVEACIRRDSRRRPSVHTLLESPYFLATVRPAYLFIAPLQLLAKEGTRLRYAANFAKQGGLKAMGPFAAEMCALHCLELLETDVTNSDAESAYTLLRDFLRYLKPMAIKSLIIPAIQKILQATGYSHLKVSLLQDSFVRELWNRIGKQAYLETVHPLVLSNLYTAPHKSSAAASVLLIGSSEELGVPVTVHQTILPVIQHFGRGVCNDVIDVLIRIGGLFGETFVVTQMLPLLKNVILSCFDVSYTNKLEPMQNWITLACIDCFMALEGLVAGLSGEVIVNELIHGKNCLHATVLLQNNLDLALIQVAATTLISLCQRIGPELTASHVLPQLKELFDELAFAQETGRSSKVSKANVDDKLPIKSRMDLVFLLYPSFASILGIEKLRQCCPTWLLLEQILLRCHNWKWECSGESSNHGAESIMASRPVSSLSTSDDSSARMLLNGVGWSIPQSQGNRGAKLLMPQKTFHELQNPVGTHSETPKHGKHESWFWFPSPAAAWEGLDFLGRSGGLKDESPWKIRASVIYSVRAHHGALRSLAVCEDECTAFSAGVGTGFKGTVQKWDLTGIRHVTGYYGHDEVVNDMCILSTTGRVASSDGTVHIWNSQTGKKILVFSEASSDSGNFASSPTVAQRNVNQGNILNSNSLSSGILNSAFDGTLYTSMHLLEFVEKLVLGTGNGCLRFVDLVQGRKLHLWRSESLGTSFPSLISSICSCGMNQIQRDGASAFPSWIAVGLSSGDCRMLDARSGSVFASWHAHDGYLTKIAAPEDHLLVSSSLDKTIKIWDLRRGWKSHPIVVRGHKDGISSFSLWGQDIISISKNKIGLTSLSRNTDEDYYRHVTPQKLYIAAQGSQNLSALSSISIMPFSRLFLVGTEDGYLRVCC